MEIIRYDILLLNVYKLDTNAQEEAADAKSTVDIEDSRSTRFKSALCIAPAENFFVAPRNIARRNAMQLDITNMLESSVVDTVIGIILRTGAPYFVSFSCSTD